MVTLAVVFTAVGTVLCWTIIFGVGLLLRLGRIVERLAEEVDEIREMIERT